MELYQLRSFIAVARAQNLTRAASELFVSQSALSSQLKALEEEWGVELFRRSPRGMELTDQGRVLLTHAAEVVDAADQLTRKAATLTRAGTRSLTIGLNADPTFLRVSAVNLELSALKRPLNVVFLTSQTVRTPAMLRRGTIDIGFFYGESGEEDISSRVVARVPILTVIPAGMGPENPSWEEIAALPWIWVGAESPFYERMGAMLAKRGLAPNRKVSAADEQVVKELVAAGQGVAMLREDEASPLVAAGKVRVWEEGGLTIPLSLGWLSKNESDPALLEVVGAIGRVWG